jgi:hypothetical protein
MRQQFSWLSLSRFAWASMAALIMLMLAGAARGDTVDLFNVQGTGLTFPNGPLVQFSGDMLIDTTTGTLRSINIQFPGIRAFTLVDNSFPFGSQWEITAIPIFAAARLRLQFTTTTPGSLVGFTGGIITAGQAINFDTFQNLSGEITLVGPVEIPEPSSLTLLDTGLLCCLGYGLMRKRNKTALVQRPTQFSMMS